MRVAVVSESFLPTLNGVTTSVARLLEHLEWEGHDATLIVPAAGAPSRFSGFAVHEVAAVPYRRFPVGLPNHRLALLLAGFDPDVVHVAAPFLLGAQALATARRMGVPSVAIYQTDLPAYSRSNGLRVTERIARRIIGRIHDGADLTLAPSSSAAGDLLASGVDRVARWGRGVDIELFHPRHGVSPETAALRGRLAPAGEVLVGYIGRLAPEKQVERLAQLRGIPGIRLVIVGDGPSLPAVRRALRGIPVEFLGALTGPELATAYSALDVFVHTGVHETFGQTIQEAQASGRPVVAPAAGGPLDLVETGTDGFLYEPTGGGMREAVLRLADDQALRARFGEAGRRKVLTRSWPAVFDELLAHYGSVMGGTGPGAPEAGRDAASSAASRALRGRVSRHRDA